MRLYAQVADTKIAEAPQNTDIIISIIILTTCWCVCVCKKMKITVYDALKGAKRKYHHTRFVLRVVSFILGWICATWNNKYSLMCQLAVRFYRWKYLFKTMYGEVVEEALLMTFVDNKLSHGISALIKTCMYAWWL